MAESLTYLQLGIGWKDNFCRSLNTFCVPAMPRNRVSSRKNTASDKTSKTRRPSDDYEWLPSSLFLGKRLFVEDAPGFRIQRKIKYKTSSAEYLSNLVPTSQVSRLFGPAIFESSKLHVQFLGVGEEMHPGHGLPRTYTLTHCDITAELTLAVSQTINRAQLQGWCNKFQRDEVVAEWRKAQDKMSLHVHCHISGGQWLLDATAKLRFIIFRKKLPVVLEAFRFGDQALLSGHPELEQALVWVYFHSNVKEFNRVECWGPLADAAKGEIWEPEMKNEKEKIERPRQCGHPCKCCYPPLSLIGWADDKLLPQPPM